MIYKVLRPITRFVLKLYFRKIYISGLEHIKQDVPVIFVCNHPTAFIEPCLLACLLPRQLHFLVRGDFFSKPWLSWLLVGTNQIPIFRQKDGIQNVKKNLITQEHVLKLFQANKALLMFPEARTKETIYLRPLKKGIARFAFMADNDALQIVPIGVNFDRHVLFNSKVSIQVGEAIPVKPFLRGTYNTESDRFKAILEQIRISMQANVREIPEGADQEDAHVLFKQKDARRKESLLPIVEQSNEILVEEQQLAQSKKEPEFSALQKLWSKYQMIHQLNAFQAILMVLGLPILLLFAICHGWYVLLLRMFIKKKIRSHEFKAPLFISLSLAVNVFVYIICILLGLIWSSKIWIFLLLYVLIGILGVYYLKAFQFKWNYLFLNKEDKKLIFDV